MLDKDFYQIIADELKANQKDSALWIQAKATTEGDVSNVEAAYIRLRFVELKKNALLSSSSYSLAEDKKTEPEAKPQNSELLRIRNELARELPAQRKKSLYSTLKVHPGASDAKIATAIAELDSRNLAELDISPAEFKYAKDTLSNPVLRERYDRQLYGSMLNNFQKPYQSYASDALEQGDSWWETSKTSIIIGVLSITILGYLGLNYIKERNRKETMQELAETQSKAVDATLDTNQIRVQNEQMRIQADIDFRNEALKLAAQNQQQDMDLRTKMFEQAQEQQRIQQEYRANADEQRKKTQMEQAENARIAKEKKYYACMNQQLTVQLTQRYPGTYDASARCAAYR